MKRNQKLLILSLIVLVSISCALCDDMPSGSVFERILGCDYSSEAENTQLSKYPQKYAGTVNIKTWTVCESQADATFSVFDDETCALSVSYPMAYQNYEGLMPGDAGYGACKPNGETELWIINGVFSKKQQVCKFKSCNDQNYIASGSIIFDLNTATGLSDSIQCSNDKGEQQIQISLDKLFPISP